MTWQYYERGIELTSAITLIDTKIHRPKSVMARQEPCFRNDLSVIEYLTCVETIA